MNNLSTGAVVVAAIIIGLIAGVSAAFMQNNGGKSDTTTAAANSSKELEKQDLSDEVLKALSPEQLAELYPEKAEAILVPEAFDHIKASGGNAHDPAYLREVLEKMGITAPDDASTRELRDLISGAKEAIDRGQK